MRAGARSKLNRRASLAASQRAVVALLSAADRVRRHFSQLVEPQGITLQQYNVLRILRGAGREGLPTMEVRQRMIEQAPGITGLINRLQAKGWVRRQRAPHDRREVRCHITSSGLVILKRLDTAVNAADRTAFSALDETEVRRLVRLLEQVGGGLSRE